MQIREGGVSVLGPTTGVIGHRAQSNFFPMGGLENRGGGTSAFPCGADANVSKKHGVGPTISLGTNGF